MEVQNREAAGPKQAVTGRSRVLVTGLVQGVFFRDFTQRRAEELGLSGWVRNLPDGRVEAVAEGSKQDILAWVELLKQGPPGSRVDAVDLDWEPATGEFRRFEVRYSSGSSSSK